MKRRSSNLNFSSRVPNRLVWSHELTPQEFTRQTSPKTPRFHRIIKFALAPITLIASGADALASSKSKVLGGMMIALLALALFQLLPIVINSNSELLKSLNPPKPLSGLEIGSRLATLKPLSKAEITYTIKDGDTLGSIVRRYNLSIVEAADINKAIESYRTKEKLPHLLKPGVELSFIVDSKGVKKLSIPLSAGRTLSIKRDKEGLFSASLSEVSSKRSQRVATGLIESSFAEAARNSGLSYAMVDDLVDLFGNKVVFHRDFRKGDRFSIIYSEEKLASGEIIGNDQIIAASVEVNGRIFHAIRYTGKDKKARFFDTDGNVIGDTFLRYPVKFSRISSLFSEARFHPIHNINIPHNGVDFAAPTGTPVRSVADGIVTFAGRKGAAGIMVKIQHDSRYSTAYLHLSRIESGVRNGTKIERGQIIGAVGSTGNSTGPHLHYSLYDRGRYVDPLSSDLPMINNLTPGQIPTKNYILKTRGLLDAYLEEPVGRMVFNQKLPAKHLPLISQSFENA